MKSHGLKAKNLKYVSVEEVGLLALLIYKGCEAVGKACIEGGHYYIFDENNTLNEVFATYGYEDEALVQGSAFCEIVLKLQSEIEDSHYE